MRSKSLCPRLEVLEDRLTPALTYLLDAAGNLSVTGQTTNAALTITENGGNSVTVMDGAASKTFAVPGNLTVNVQSLTGFFVASLNFNGNAAGNVSLSASSLGSVDMLVGANAASTVGGNLSLKTATGDDFVFVNGAGGAAQLTVAGSLSVDTGAGSDFVAIGGTGPLAVRGNMFAYNVNTMLFSGAGGAVSVGGLTNVNTDNSAGGANLVSTDTGTSMAGDLLVNGNTAAANSVFLAGTVAGRVYAQLGNGAGSGFFSSGSIAGNLTILGGNGGDLVTVAGTIAGSVSITLGNGNNFTTIGATFIAGSSISYYGGNGVDNVTFDGPAPSARLNVNLGAGDDVFTLGPTASLLSAYLNGGFGINTFTSSLPAINFPITLVNFQ